MKDYHVDRTGNFSKIVSTHLGECTLIDCGANLGMYAAQVICQSQNIRSAVLFEPNPEYAKIAEKNLSWVDFPYDIHVAAVSDYNGKAQILAPTYNPNPEAFFIDKTDNGKTTVYTVDSIVNVPLRSIAIKIDVEGEEVAVLNGAHETLRAAEKFALMIEFNKAVFLRTHTSQTDIIKAVADIREVRWYNADDLREINPNDDVFLQTGRDVQCDLIALTT